MLLDGPKLAVERLVDALLHGDEAAVEDVEAKGPNDTASLNRFAARVEHVGGAVEHGADAAEELGEERRV